MNFRIFPEFLFLENERIRGVVELSGLDADVEMEDMLEGKGFLIATKRFILDGKVVTLSRYGRVI